ARRVHTLARRAADERERRAVRVGPARQENGRFRRAVEADLADVRRDADHACLICEARVDPAIPEVADLYLAIARRRILPERTLERFVDEGHRLRAGYAGVAELTVAAKRDAERGEIPRRDDP